MISDEPNAPSDDPKPPLPAGWTANMAPGWGMDGRQLHGMCEGSEGVPVKRWCVSQSDLIFLRKSVKQAIKEGLIHPTGQDPFDPSDDVIGPNMYTVCDQYIKPLTKDAGSMSWALMRNPKGLECDLFITHAWIEGVFEFIDKTLTSWPAGKRACYICILSNPQNLDIGALIKTPSDSPFALCLNNASHMLVIPNKHSSIYSRLWCVYEAWLAFVTGKTILTASAPVARRVCRSLFVLCIVYCIGLALGASVAIDLGMDDDECRMATFNFLVVCCMFLAVVTVFVRRFQCTWLYERNVNRDYFIITAYPLWLCCNVIGAFASGMALASTTASFNLCMGKSHRFIEDGILYEVSEQYQVWGLIAISFTLAAYFFGSEADRVREFRNSIEAEELRQCFTSVGNAECSSAADKNNIMQEVSNELQDVDMCVSVLLLAGMSTPSLRLAARRGVNVKNAAYFSLRSVCFTIGAWLSFNITFCAFDEQAASLPLKIMFVCGNSLAVLLIIVWYCYYSSADNQCFMISVATKMQLLSLFPLLTTEHSFVMPTLLAGLVIFGTLTLLVCSIAGMAGIARLPLVGPFLAGVLAPGTNMRLYRSYQTSTYKAAAVTPCE